MKEFENEFKHKGVDFKVILRGKKAVMLEASASFYPCKSVEVWQLRKRKETKIGNSIIPSGYRKPSNEDYPFTAHQFMENHFESLKLMYAQCEIRFNEYEDGTRPKKLNL